MKQRMTGDVSFVLEPRKSLEFARRNARVIIQYTTALPFRLPNTKIMCVICFKDFSDTADFRKQMFNDHGYQELSGAFKHIHAQEYYLKVDVTELKCRVCSSEFQTLQDVCIHLQTVQNIQLQLEYDLGLQPFRFHKDKMRCTMGTAEFATIRSLSRHVQSHFVKFTCDTCGKSYSSAQTLQMHTRYDHSEKKLCRPCKKSFDTLEERWQHMSESPRCWIHICNECGERFMTPTLRRRLFVLYEVHDTKSVFPCSLCPERFVSSKNRLCHYKLIHSDNFLTCSWCDKRFASQRSLDDHLPVHTAEKLFPCSYCSKSFSRKKSLSQHSWIHKEVKRFECKPCNKQFNQRVSWKTHMSSYHLDAVLQLS